MNWTAQQDAMLREWWAADYSATEISEKLWTEHRITKSRCAVIGRAHRLKLPKVDAAGISARQSRAQKRRPARRQRIAATVQLTRIQAIKALPHLVISSRAAVARTSYGEPSSVMDRTGCHWPVGDPRHADFHFCNGPLIFDVLPYCHHHCRIAYYAP